MAETIVEAPGPGVKEVALYAMIPVEVAEWLDKVSKIGFSKKELVDYALKKLMEADLETVLMNIVRGRAEEATLLVKEAVEEKAEEEVKAE